MKRQPRSSPRSTKTLRTVSIIGTGSYVPEKILTNADLSRMVDTSDDWITTRTGIKERRIAAKDENTSDMAAKAALNAIEQAKISPKEIDLIIVATATPDMLFPATACFVQKKIGATKAACLDISAACAGFLFGFGNRTTIHHLAHARHGPCDRGREIDIDHELDRSQHLRSFWRWRRRRCFAPPRQRSWRHQHSHRQRRPVHRHFVHAGRRFALPDHAGKCRHAFGNDPHDRQGSVQTGRDRHAQRSEKSPRSSRAFH